MPKWTATHMHRNCKECAECAAQAVEYANQTNAAVSESSVLDGEWPHTTILHHARAELVKEPGKTLAESLGLDIPADAPGGAKIPSPANMGLTHTFQEITQAQYEGDYE